MEFNSGYSIFIEGKNVNAYVDAKNMRPLKQRCEGEKLWEFWFDTVSFRMHRSCFGLLGINENTYTSLYKTKAQLWQHGRLLVSGIIGEPGYSKDTHWLDIEIRSYGRVLKDLPLLNGLNFYGKTLDDIISSLLYHVNGTLALSGYSFTLKQFIDVENFTFYWSLKKDDYIDILAYSSLERQGLYYNENNQLYFIWKFFNGDYWITRISGTIIEYAAGVRKKSLEGYISAEDFINDDANADVVQMIKWSTTGSVLGVANDISSGGYLVYSEYYPADTEFGLSGDLAQIRLTRYKRSTEDVFWCEYKTGTNVGNILAGLAKMTNSVVWVSADAIIYFQSRPGLTALSTKSAYNIKSKTVVKAGNIDIPTEFIVLKSVKEDLVEYWHSIEQGTFEKTEAVIDAKQFDSSDKQLMLRKLPLATKSGAGRINSIEYLGNRFVIETERFISA